MTQTADAVDLVKDKYEQRITSLLGSYRVALTLAGYDCNPEVERNDLDEYRWCQNFYFGPRNPDNRWENWLGVEFTIRESRVHDHETEDGVNFAITLVAEGGRVPFEFSPHNFTPNCWVDAKDLGTGDAGPVWRRFYLMYGVTPEHIVVEVKEYLAGH